MIFLLAGAVQAAPTVQTWVHDSGAKVAWVAASTIPMLDVRIEFDAGSRRDPPDQAGLAAAAAHMSMLGLRAAEDQPALGENPLAEQWMDLGAQWGMAAGSDRLSASLRTLTDPSVRDAAVALASRQLAHPDWTSEVAQAAWLRERSRMVANWQEAMTRPDTQARRQFSQAVYGRHPYGLEVTPESLSRIGLADMARWWQQHVRPCHARISLVGAVTRDEANAIVTRLMQPLLNPGPARAGSQTGQGGEQAQACPALPVLPEVAALAAPADIRVPMQVAQAHVLVGQPGYRRADPDAFALLVGNYILGGGGFVSRLTSEVREKRGLSYSVYSYFQPGIHAGAFMVGLQTRPDQARQALDVARQVVGDFVDNGPTDAELAAAKASLVNGFALRIDSNAKLLDNVANMLWFDLPPDYLVTWSDRVREVTQAQVRQAFARVLQPQRMVAVTVGGKAD